MKKFIFFIVFLTACSQNQQIESNVPEPNPGYLYPDENGVSLPEDFHIAWPIETWSYSDGKKIKVDSERRILQMLEKEKMEYEFVIYSGHKFLVWNAENDECVNKIINNQWCD